MRGGWWREESFTWEERRKTTVFRRHFQRTGQIRRQFLGRVAILCTCVFSYANAACNRKSWYGLSTSRRLYEYEKMYSKEGRRLVLRGRWLKCSPTSPLTENRAQTGRREGLRQCVKKENAFRACGLAFAKGRLVCQTVATDCRTKLRRFSGETSARDPQARKGSKKSGGRPKTTSNTAAPSLPLAGGQIAGADSPATLAH